MAIIPTSGEFTKVPEGGGGGGAFVVTVNNNTLDKTWAEISQASENRVVVLRTEGFGSMFGYLWSVSTNNEDIWDVTFLKYVAGDRDEGWVQYHCAADSENGYPVHE